MSRNFATDWTLAELMSMRNDVCGDVCIGYGRMCFVLLGTFSSMAKASLASK